ncbi:hypothetical protein AMK15_15950 [Streptomyces sp. MJM1172]|nr:hypothetical protein AMK15_15950 [Streptomyces sp. MJM1172]
MRAATRAPYAEKPIADDRWRREEVTRVTPGGGTTVQDFVALAEIELCGELIIAASTADEERLSQDRIDEVLMVGVSR